MQREACRCGSARAVFDTLPFCFLILSSTSFLAVLVQALLKEVVAYQRMEKLWGVFVPRLIGYGTTCNGRAVFVATELIDGVELGEGRIACETIQCEACYSPYSDFECFL
jgi:hypothetical protein